MTNKSTMEAYLEKYGIELSEDELAHFGVKGMRWGKRKAVDSGSDDVSPRQAKKLEKADRKWERNATTQSAYFKIYNEAATRMNNDIDKINGKAEYKNADLSKPSSLQKKYYKEHSEAMTKHLNDVASAQGTSPSGKKRLKFDYDVERDDLPQWEVVEDE
jgi:hypothetical protein